VVRAEELLEARGQASLPPGITRTRSATPSPPSSSRSTNHVSVMRQLGHTDPALTLRAYAHSMSGGVDERERLRAITEGYEVVGEGTREFGRNRLNLLRGGKWVASQPGPERTAEKSAG
jgi:hypothetical protein